jgi:hypothetical protein
MQLTSISVNFDKPAIFRMSAVDLTSLKNLLSQLCDKNDLVKKQNQEEE